MADLQHLPSCTCCGQPARPGTPHCETCIGNQCQRCADGAGGYTDPWLGGDR